MTMNYQHWSGRTRSMPAPDGWLNLGHGPIPRGPWRSFVYHAAHGLLMGFPPISVLVWSWRHRCGNWWDDPSRRAHPELEGVFRA